MKYIQTILLSVLLLTAAAQQKSVTGTVISKQNGIITPLHGVTISTNQTNTTTDENGRFSIKAKEEEIITFSYVGMKTITLTVTNTTFNQPATITMENEQSSLNEVVVTGYQTQKKADLTGAVSVVKTSDIKDIPLGNPVKAIQGRIPGVFITTDGSPASNATIRIRGIGTLGNNNPLFVIDGIPTDRGLNEINEADIESMQVLKDASAATIYGSRAANGVIIITTKKGKKGTAKIDFNASVSTQSYLTKERMLDTDGRGRAVWQAAINDGTDPNTASQIYKFETNYVNGKPVLNKIILPEYIDADKTMKPANTNWFNEISHVSVIKNADLSFSNGNERGTSLLSLSYYDNSGIVRGSSLKRLTARANTEYKFLNDRLIIGENLSGTYSVGTQVPADMILDVSVQSQPIVPVHTVEGGWGGPAPGMADRQNPVRLIEDNLQNKSYFYRVFGSAYAIVKILRDFSFKTNIGVDYNGTYARTLRKSYSSGFLSDPTNQVNTSQNYSGNWIWQNTLDYNKKIKDHSIQALVGSEAIKYMSQGFWGSRYGYALETIDYAYLDAGSGNKDNGGIGSDNSLMSFFGKVNYTYKGRYLASGTIRRDGSSRFGQDNRYAYFPAYSLGWRISEENFVKDNALFISDLKLRYGWGKTGNQSIADNAIYDLYSSIYGIDPTWDRDRGSAYNINGGNNGQLPSGFTKTQRGNNSLKWESTTQSNFGLDFGFFNQKISGSVDYFTKNTSDILLTPPSLAVIGEGGDPTVNGASMSNKGWEGIINYDTKLGKDLSLFVSANIATYRNKITKLPENSLNAFAGNGNDKIIIGRSVGSYFGYVADGIFQNQAEVDAASDQGGKGVGRIRFKDLNGDKQITGNDRDYIGISDPKFTYGLSINVTYKKFDAGIFIQGVQGGLVNTNATKKFTDFSSIWPGTNWGTRTLSAWTPDNTSSTIPMLSLVDRNDEGRFSTYFLEPGSYCRLRNLQIGYDLSNWSKNIKINKLRVFLVGSNLLTIKSKKYTGPDPEAPNNTFPIPAICTFGLNVSL